MPKLKKIYIENFKGISTTRIVDFESSDVSILNGPNGFGKTTIFDAIELCIRGKLERTVQFSSIQKNTQNYRKPFYQNTTGKDVVLKILFHDTQTDLFHIIIKQLDHTHNGKIGNSKSFRPDAWGILNTYYSTDETTFDEPLDVETCVEYTQKEVDQLFFNEDNLSQESLYPLFNYLQQEENIYFLKKDEEEKKAELDFLFQTQKEAEELHRLTQFSKNLKNIHSELNEKIAQLSETANSGELINYIKLFTDRDLPYDNEEPFKNQVASNLKEVFHSYTTELSKVEEFVSSFDPDEYQLDKLRQSLAYMVENQQMLYAFVLQKLTDEESYVRLEKLRAIRATFNNQLKNLATDKIDIESILALGFDIAFISEYSQSIEAKKKLEENIGVIGQVITDLNQARMNSIELSQQLPTDLHAPQNCPLCNADYVHTHQLIEKVNEKTQSLIGFNEDQLRALETANKNLTDTYRRPIEERTAAFLSAAENQLEEDFYKYILQYRGYGERIKRFQTVIKDGGLSFDEFILTEPKTMFLFLEDIEKLKTAVLLDLTKIIPDQEKLLHKELFKELFSENRNALFTVTEINNKKIYVEFKYNEARLFSLNILTDRRNSIGELEQKVSRIKVELAASIKTYKMEMIEKIKIPFYLFSGKILQNYQQGLGIFIDMQETTNRIKFLTDSESDHDIIHHLSSGQLAVVSIAFCLALNKVYESSNHFKFLAIDDPVQTLDDINIHSFIELVRHEFRDYQIIMSTHEDDIASYLSYKFEKFHFICNTLKVQKLFYNE